LPAIRSEGVPSWLAGPCRASAAPSLRSRSVAARATNVMPMDRPTAWDVAMRRDPKGGPDAAKRIRRADMAAGGGQSWRCARSPILRRLPLSGQAGGGTAMDDEASACD
jgi:hypothetical protein